jgi:hypothetical protein
MNTSVVPTKKAGFDSQGSLDTKIGSGNTMNRGTAHAGGQNGSHLHQFLARCFGTMMNCFFHHRGDAARPRTLWM